MENFQTTTSESGQRPFFSVIIPVHNKAPHINRSVSSVIGQSFSNFEIIIIDDASTDTSLDEINRFDDPRIKIFQRTRPGPGGYAARNFGIEKSRSEWIAFLDADDEWHTTHLENAFNGIEKFPDVGMVSSGWLEDSGGDNKKYNSYFLKNKIKGLHVYDIRTYIQGSRPIHTAVAIVRKELLCSVGGFDEQWQHGADTDLWLRLLLIKDVHALWIPECGATYYKDSVNRVTSNLSQYVAPSAVSIKKYLKAGPRIPKDLQLQLMQYANKISVKAFVRKTVHDTISARDIAGIFFFTKLPVKRQICIVVVCLLPAFIRKKAAPRIIKQFF